MLNPLRTSTALSAAALLLAASAAAAQPAPGRPACFYPNQLESWKASPDAQTVYLRIGANKIFRMDLARPCTELQLPMASIEMRAHGAAVYCHAIDFELYARQPHGPPANCQVDRMSLLSREDAAALPRDLRP